jgi:hypothetical protein
MQTKTLTKADKLAHKAARKQRRNARGKQWLSND